MEGEILAHGDQTRMLTFSRNNLVTRMSARKTDFSEKRPRQQGSLLRWCQQRRVRLDAKCVFFVKCRSLDWSLSLAGSFHSSLG